MPSRRRSGKESFYDLLSKAVDEFTDQGYQSAEQLEEWLRRMRAGIDGAIPDDLTLTREMRETLDAIYKRMVDRGEILRQHPNVARFTYEKVKPKLRAELDRRIVASANLIKLNRKAAIDSTIHRMSGWMTSIPPGGTDVKYKQEVKDQARKSLASLPFEARRVVIDQSHKFVSNLSEILATDGSALAGIWHSHYKQLHYNYRPDHRARDSEYYAVRNNWALQRGLMKPGPKGYTDQITKPGEEVFCRCWYEYVYALRDLPDYMVTDNGRAELQRVGALLS